MNCLNHFRNSFHLTIGMKRKTTDENDEFEGKRGRSISNGSNGYGNHSPNAQNRGPGAQQKCFICLWPQGAPQCYHSNNVRR